MKLPLPLRFTIPAALLLFGLFLGGLSFVYELTTSYRRIEEDVRHRAEFLGQQTSEMLRYHLTQGDLDAAERQIVLLRANETLRFAIVCDEQSHVLLSTRRDMQNQSLDSLPLAATAREVIGAARMRIVPSLGFPRHIAPHFILTPDRRTMSAAFLFPIPPDSDTLEYAGVATLYFEYDLGR